MMNLKNMLMTASLIALLSAGGVSCNDGDRNQAPQPGATAPVPTPSALPSGTTQHTFSRGIYGGKDFEINVAENSVTFRFACAQGQITHLIVTDANGSFDTEGTYQAMSGPVPQGGYPTYPVRYSGTVQNGEVVLNVAHVDNQAQSMDGQFNATYGQDPDFNVVCALSSH